MTPEQKYALSGERSIALRLTNEQVKQILGVLKDAKVDADSNQLEKLQALQDAVVEASFKSTEQVRCKSCGNLFSAKTGRRPAHYCSASCKQKAYRHRLAQRDRV